MLVVEYIVASITVMFAINNMEKRSIETHIYSEFEDRFQSFAAISLLFLTAGFIMPTRRN